MEYNPSMESLVDMIKLTVVHIEIIIHKIY